MIPATGRTYPSAPASLIDPTGSFYQAYAEAYGSPSPYGGLRARASECEDHRWPASDGVRNRSAAKLNPVDIAPQQCLPVAGSHLVHHSGAGFRLQFQTASVTSPTGATAGASSGLSAPLRLFQFVRAFCRALGTRLSNGNTRVKFLQEPSRGFANPFHFNLSAPSRGLAAVVYGQDDDRRKQGNVRQSGGEIRNVEC